MNKSDNYITMNINIVNTGKKSSSMITASFNEGADRRVQIICSGAF